MNKDDNSEDSSASPNYESELEPPNPGNKENDLSEPNSTSLRMPNVKENSSQSSIHGRFWDSSSDNQEIGLPTISHWRPIKDPEGKRHLDYNLSHPE